MIVLLSLLSHAHAKPPDTAAEESRQNPVIAIDIDPTKRFQTMRGFGASGAWWPNYVAEFPEQEREQMLRYLFTGAGADLTIYRYNLPAGDGPDVTDPLRRTALVEIAPGVYDFDRDWKAQLILKEVRALGVEQFVLFANSPPPRMLINGKVSGGDDGRSNLRPGAQYDFANYLLDVSAYLIDKYDLPQVVLSPINEPQWRWGRDHRRQEGCHYTPEELAATVRALVEANLERGLNLEIEAPESGEWKNANYDFARALFSDPVINEHIRTYAVHSYWSSPADRRRFVNWFKQQYPLKALAMTEYCQMEHGHDLTIEGGLHLANVMHEDLVVANVETWQWWLSIFTGGYKDALIYAHPRTRKIEPTKRLWAMGNFSRFVRPGAIRVAAESESDLRISAFIDKDEEKIAVIIINNGGARTVRPAITNKPTRSLEAWVTSAEHDLALLPATDPDGIGIPRLSVVTLVISLREQAGSRAEAPEITR